MQARSDRPASLRVALIGCPNVGKSSLFNALARTPSALVSDAAGTTRDYVTTPFACQGLEGLLIDTAGVESGAESELVAAAQAAASQQRQQASLQLLCLDATRPLNAWERAAIADPPAGDRLLVVTKIDEPCQFELPAGAIATSSRTGAGLEQLQRAIAHYAADSSGGEGAVVGATAVRCRESLRQARSALGEARQAALHGIGEELVAAEIRIALEELGKVVGAVYTEDLLDRIFSRFCIGK
jgi:tRNA modification GTPase